MKLKYKFVNIIINPSTFDIANVFCSLSGIHWQQTLLMGPVCKPILKKYPKSVMRQIRNSLTHLHSYPDTHLQKTYPNSDKLPTNSVPSKGAIELDIEWSIKLLCLNWTITVALVKLPQ